VVSKVRICSCSVGMIRWCHVLKSWPLWPNRSHPRGRDPAVPLLSMCEGMGVVGAYAWHDHCPLKLITHPAFYLNTSFLAAAAEVQSRQQVPVVTDHPSKFHLALGSCKKAKAVQFPHEGLFLKLLILWLAAACMFATS
jgi:hypothetical protein